MSMKKALLLLVFALAALFTTSCRTTYNVSLQPELENLLVGRTYAEIVDAFGAPDRTTPDGRGGQIIVYEDVRLRTDGSVNPWTRSISLATESSKGFMHMYLTDSDVCYQVRTNREKEVSEFSKGKTIGLIAGVGGGSLTVLLAYLLSDIRKK